MAAADTPPFQMRQCVNPLITWRLMGRQWILVEKKEDASGPKESPGNTEIGIGLGIPSPPPLFCSRWGSLKKARVGDVPIDPVAKKYSSGNYPGI